jgi:hypothetical protein
MEAVKTCTSPKKAIVGMTDIFMARKRSAGG